MIDLYWELFFTFFKIGLFGFGGGYAMLSMVQYEVVEAHGWLTMGEFTDIVAISQMTPGPIIVNSATYIGYTATGGSIVGSLTATCAVCLPAILIMVLICRFFMMFKQSLCKQSIAVDETGSHRADCRSGTDDDERT